MTEIDQKQLGNTLWGIADQLRGAMNADDFRDYMLSFLFLRYLSDNYAQAAQKELGADYPELGAVDRRTPLALWYAQQQIAELFQTSRTNVVEHIQHIYGEGELVETADRIESD